MTRPLLAAAALALVLAAPAAARDSRLVSRLYNAEEVVRIEGRAGVQASIAFAEDEHIENVAIGDSASWQVTPNKRANLLFVKPLNARARTNLTVVTDRRTYFFDLVAAPTASPLYVLRFTYPEEPKSAPSPQSAGLTADEAGVVSGTAPVQAPVDPATLNFAWESKGKSSLIPARVYDDGAATYLAWAPGSPMPAFLIRDEKGAEGPVNFSVRDGVIVIDGVPPLIVLRSGRDMATLARKGAPRLAVATAAAPAAAPAAAAPGATDPGAIDQVKGQ